MYSLAFLYLWREFFFFNSMVLQFPMTAKVQNDARFCNLFGYFSSLVCASALCLFSIKMTRESYFCFVWFFTRIFLEFLPQKFFSRFFLFFFNNHLFVLSVGCITINTPKQHGGERTFLYPYIAIDLLHPVIFAVYSEIRR